jgi:uncharacterized iron-regulated membrane protein
MSRVIYSRTIVALMVGAAIATPVASARPIDPPTSASADRTSPTEVPSSPSTGTLSGSSSSFDWGDAAIGAAGMLTLLSLATGAATVARRRRGHGHPATTN